MTSDPDLLSAFRKQARTILDGGNVLAFLGLREAWKSQPGISQDDLVDVLREEGAEPP